MDSQLGDTQCEIMGESTAASLERECHNSLLFIIVIIIISVIIINVMGVWLKNPCVIVKEFQ